MWEGTSLRWGLHCGWERRRASKTGIVLWLPLPTGLIFTSVVTFHHWLKNGYVNTFLQTLAGKVPHWTNNAAPWCPPRAASVLTPPAKPEKVALWMVWGPAQTSPSMAAKCKWPWLRAWPSPGPDGLMRRNQNLCLKGHELKTTLGFISTRNPYSETHPFLCFCVFLSYLWLLSHCCFVVKFF